MNKKLVPIIAIIIIIFLVGFYFWQKPNSENPLDGNNINNAEQVLLPPALP
ncbi:MAG: hypothetical protein AAB432_02435 [Patescibacteria group bacterium]